jgi:methylmalonyl-CoA mutase N-terminal domain/subunit
LESRAREYLSAIDGMGGMLRAIETGYVQREIHEAAYAHQQAVEAGTKGVVGVNRFAEEEGVPATVFEPDPRVEKERAAALAAWRSSRDAAACEKALAGLEAAARGTDNLLPHILASVEAHATLGEISDRLRNVFGVYRPPALF